MPPESIPIDKNDNLQNLANLTNQSKSLAPSSYGIGRIRLIGVVDVAVLYQIIKAAEKDPNAESHPFRALFSAYDEILPQNGISSNHDQIYLRFLFRLGDRRGEHVSLYENFERLLYDLGIQIEFDGDEDVIQDLTRGLNDTDQDKDFDVHNDDRSPRRLRRASLQSIYDAKFENFGATPTPSLSRHNTAQAFPGNDNSHWDKKGSLDLDFFPNDPGPRSHSVPAKTDRFEPQQVQDKDGDQRLALKDNLAAISPKSDSNDSMSTTYSAELSQNNSRDPIKAPAPQIDSHIEDDPADFNFALHDRERFYAPSNTQLIRDASIFLEYRLQAISVHAIKQWRDSALQAKHQHCVDYRKAESHDAHILLSQALDFWTLRVRERKQVAETRQYFNRLEERAIMARNLYLLAKAFSHWYHSAEDEAWKVSIARQHVLALKYFHAWKDFTLGNQAKIHAHGLQKHFVLWNKRYVKGAAYEIKADLIRQRTLLKSVYWQWFWGFCERRAPAWYSRRLKQKHFSKWIDAFRFNERRNSQVSLHVEKAARKFFLQHWHDRAKVIISTHVSAQAFNWHKTAASYLRAWTKTYDLTSPAQQASNMVDWRVAGSVFATFVGRFRLEKQAEKINQLRLLRNAWTLWNDCLRCRAFAGSVDDRRLLEALYKWTIAQRGVLLKRLMDERLGKRHLLRLKEHWEWRDSSRKQAYQNLQDQHGRHLLSAHLGHWHSSRTALRQQEQVATTFSNLRRLRHVPSLLVERGRQIQSFSAMASDAYFYFATKRCLRKWHSRLVESKRQKRRLAYMQIRRTSKINMASCVLERWRTNANERRQMSDSANSFNLERQLGLATRFFDYWKSLYYLVVERNLEAQDYHQMLILRHLFHGWFDRADECAALNGTAVLRTQLYERRSAITCINRLRIRIIELKGPLATAQNLRARYQKRHFLNILRRWQVDAATRTHRPQRHSTPSLFASTLRYSVGAQDEEFPGMLKGPRSQVSTIPRASEGQSPPRGTLTTPSKRAMRARIGNENSTTPSGTPFQSRRRTQLGTTPQTTTRLLFRRTPTLRDADTATSQNEIANMKAEPEQEQRSDKRESDSM